MVEVAYLAPWSGRYKYVFSNFSFQQDSLDKELHESVQLSLHLVRDSLLFCVITYKNSTQYARPAGQLKYGYGSFFQR